MVYQVGQEPCGLDWGDGNVNHHHPGCHLQTKEEILLRFVKRLD
jgi:hypothetical protein